MRIRGGCVVVVLLEHVMVAVWVCIHIHITCTPANDVTHA